MKNINDFNDYINTLVSEFDGGDYSDFNDYAHECADGSEYVIYYHRAWDLVEMVRVYNHDLYCDSESFAFDLGVYYDSLDKTMAAVAYGIIHNAMIDAFNKQEQEVAA